jgi:hypothetical protein
MSRWRLGALTAVAALGCALVAACSEASARPRARADGGSGHRHAASAAARASDAELARKLAGARFATAKYALSLEAAKKDGYKIITPMIPDMGVHYLKPDVQGFDVNKPPILVYVRRSSGYQLVAVEWVFTETPNEGPLPGATYGSFGAACHYQDGNFVPAAAEADCAKVHPETGSPLFFWHPDLVTLHVWLWYHNPAGIYNGTNPLIAPFNS